jgi:hypothetical protein
MGIRDCADKLPLICVNPIGKRATTRSVIAWPMKILGTVQVRFATPAR